MGGSFMTTPFQASLAQIDIAALDPARNLEQMTRIAKVEADAGSKLIVFPELSNTGYVEPMVPGAPFSPGISGLGDYAARLYAAADDHDGSTVTELAALASLRGIYLVVGLALRHPVIRGRLANASMLIGPEGVVATYSKAHLWHSEKLYFAEGNDFPVAQTPVGSIGMQICYDIRFPEVSRALALGGADIITNVWASFRADNEPVADDDLFVHRAYTRAQENGTFFLSCNRVGLQSGNRFMGRSVIAGPDGTILAASRSEAEEIVRCEIDLEDVVRYRSYVGLWNDRRSGL
jgi:predicted amidohydrolase